MTVPPQCDSWIRHGVWILPGLMKWFVVFTGLNNDQVIKHGSPEGIPSWDSIDVAGLPSPRITFLITYPIPPERSIPQCIGSIHDSGSELKIGIPLHLHLYGYESKPWYPSEPQITGKWMFIPPNIARLVLIHPHITMV